MDTFQFLATSRSSVTESLRYSQNAALIPSSATSKSAKFSPAVPAIYTPTCTHSHQGWVGPCQWSCFISCYLPQCHWAFRIPLLQRHGLDLCSPMTMGWRTFQYRHTSHKRLRFCNTDWILVSPTAVAVRYQSGSGTQFPQRLVLKIQSVANSEE